MLRIVALGMMVAMTLVAMPALAEQVEAQTGADLSWMSPVGTALACGEDGDILAVYVAGRCVRVY